MSAHQWPLIVARLTRIRRRLAAARLDEAQARRDLEFLVDLADAGLGAVAAPRQRPIPAVTEKCCGAE